MIAGGLELELIFPIYLQTSALDLGITSLASSRLLSNMPRIMVFTCFAYDFTGNTLAAPTQPNLIGRIGLVLKIQTESSSFEIWQT
jgi:hypothetical protein